jgi:hypothetical protein
MAEMSSPDVEERLRAICAEVGFDFGRLEPSVVARLQLLAEHGETISDCEHTVALARKVFRYYESRKPVEAFDDTERRTVVLGCLFSDIGKTGPSGAEASAQQLIAEMFAVEGVNDHTQDVARFLTTYFSADAAERVQRFEALGLDPRMTIRRFWNLHGVWTFDILEGSGLPPEAIVAAATHHVIDDVNPGNIVAADGRFTRAFGENAAFDRAEKLVTVLDKYDAARRRGRRTHDEAIAWLRNRVANGPFHDDLELQVLIDDLNTVARAD